MAKGHAARATWLCARPWPMVTEGRGEAVAGRWRLCTWLGRVTAMMSAPEGARGKGGEERGAPCVSRGGFVLMGDMDGSMGHTALRRRGIRFLCRVVRAWVSVRGSAERLSIVTCVDGCDCDV